MHSSGESEVSPTTPVTSTAFNHESPTVFSMTSYSVNGTSLMYHHRDSLLFEPTIKDYIYHADPCYSSSYTTSEVLDCSWMDSVSWGLEAEECFDEHPVEVVCDTTSMMLMEEEDEALSPLF
jgi:hypothetical protein